MTGGPALPGVFASLAPLLSNYGYLAVAGFLLAENAGVPLPGETILIAAAVYAGAGQLNIVAVVLVAVAACVIGDNAGFALGRYGGRQAVLRYGRYVLLTEELLDTAERFFDRHGSKVVTIARFVAGLRQANGIIAGTTGMPWPRFLLFNRATRSGADRRRGAGLRRLRAAAPGPGSALVRLPRVSSTASPSLATPRTTSPSHS